MGFSNHVFQLDNGLIVLYEEVIESEAFAVGVSIPAGAVWDSDSLSGLAYLTSEMMNHGAGRYNGHSFFEALEDIGVCSCTNTSKSSVIFGMKGVCENWKQTLELLSLQILAPNFPQSELSACKQIQLQEISSMLDDPDVIVSTTFNSIFLPGRWGRRAIGDRETIDKITIDDVQTFYRSFYRPNGSIIALVGNQPWKFVRDEIEKLFGCWSPIKSPNLIFENSCLSQKHIQSSITQTIFSLGYWDVPAADPYYFASLGGINVLSGGMSSRLFTEVRERRGLCYSVSATHSTLGKKMGFVVCHCGTTTSNAQESLDLITSEIDRLSVAPIELGEIERVKIRLKSLIVIQQESVWLRVKNLITEWENYGKVYKYEDKLSKIDSLTSKMIEDYYYEHMGKKFCLVTLGVTPLDFPSERLFQSLEKEGK